MMKIDPGAIGFTSGFFQEHKYFTVGEQITVEQLIESRKVMTLSMAMIISIGITSKTRAKVFGKVDTTETYQASHPTQVDRLIPASTTIAPPIDHYRACIYGIKFMKNGVMHTTKRDTSVKFWAERIFFLSCL